MAQLHPELIRLYAEHMLEQMPKGEAMLDDRIMDLIDTNNFELFWAAISLLEKRGDMKFLDEEHREVFYFQTGSAIRDKLPPAA